MKALQALIVSACLFVVVAMGAYSVTDQVIDDAVAQGVSEEQLDAAPPVDAGSPAVTIPTEPPTSAAPDFVAQPKASYDRARELWHLNKLPFLVFIVMGIAAAINVRLRPADKDGDGKPDPEGWRGKTWAISGALVMLGVPLLAKLTGELGAGWDTVMYGAVGAVGLLMNPFNPKRGEKATT